MKVSNTQDEESRCLAEYSKDPKIKKEDIQHIMEWLNKGINFPIEEFWVIQFYTGAAYCLQKTKELIEVHYKFKNENPELFTGSDYEPPKYSSRYFEFVYTFDLPDTTSNGYRIVYCGFKDYDSSKFNFGIGLAVFIKIIYSIILERGSCEGYAFVFDMQGIHISHLSTVTISLTRKFLYFAQMAVPIKVRQVNVINANYLISKIMLLVKPFLSKELYNMIAIDSDMNDFFKRISRELIPKDLGGTLPYTRDELNILSEETVKKWEVIIQEQLKLRLTKAKDNNPSENKKISMKGTFKKLDID